MSRYTPYIVVTLLCIGAVLIWWLPPVRLQVRDGEAKHAPTARPRVTRPALVVTPTATPEATVAGGAPAE